MNVSSNSPMGQITANSGLAGRSAVYFHTGSTTANESIQLTILQRVCVVITNATYTTEFLLPPVAEAAGMLFSIYVITDGGQDLTINDCDDDVDFDTVTFADANDRGLFYSDGIHWHFIDTGAATAT